MPRVWTIRHVIIRTAFLLNSGLTVAHIRISRSLPPNIPNNILLSWGAFSTCTTQDIEIACSWIQSNVRRFVGQMKDEAKEVRRYEGHNSRVSAPKKARRTRCCVCIASTIVEQRKNYDCGTGQKSNSLYVAHAARVLHGHAPHSCRFRLTLLQVYLVYVDLSRHKLRRARYKPLRRIIFLEQVISCYPTMAM